MLVWQEERADRLVYLNKIRELFRQEWGERVDDETLLLYLLCSLKGFLQACLSITCLSRV